MVVYVVKKCQLVSRLILKLLLNLLMFNHLHLLIQGTKFLILPFFLFIIIIIITINYLFIFNFSFVCCIGLDMISLAPEFINELDLSRQHRLELNQQIKILQSKVYENITTLTSTSSSITESITISILRTLRVNLFAFYFFLLFF